MDPSLYELVRQLSAASIQILERKGRMDCLLAENEMMNQFLNVHYQDRPA